MEIHVIPEIAAALRRDESLPILLNLCRDNPRLTTQLNGGLGAAFEAFVMPIVEHLAGRLGELHDTTQIALATLVRIPSPLTQLDLLATGLESLLGLRWDYLRTLPLGASTLWAHLFRVTGYPLGQTSTGDMPCFMVLSQVSVSTSAPLWVQRADKDNAEHLRLRAFLVPPAATAQIIALGWVPRALVWPGSATLATHVTTELDPRLG